MSKIVAVDDDVLRGMLDESLIAAHRRRALTPDHPVLRGTAQNPDTFFQAREASNPYYLATPGIVRRAMDRFAQLTGRQYAPFDYAGHPEAERVVVVMGSAAETAHQTAEWLAARGEPVGVLKVRLYRPFSAADFLNALPKTVRAIAVLDRTKEPGALGEPLYQDVVTAFHEARQAGEHRFERQPTIVGGRYGLSSKEFSPVAAKAVFDELAREHPRPHFTVGIVDDVTHLSLALDPNFDIEPEDTTRAVFFGLGADGTVEREQELDQDHRRGDAAVRAGLLRLRLEEVGRDHDLAPEIRPATDPIEPSHPARELRRVPSAQVPRPLRHPRSRCAGRDLPVERAAGSRRGLGRAAPGGTGGRDREARPHLRDRRGEGRARRPARRADQHDHADLLLRALGRDPARRGDREDQGRH